MVDKSSEALRLTLPPPLPTSTICPPLVLPQVNLALVILLWLISFICLTYLGYKRYCSRYNSVPTSDDSTPLTSTSPPLYPSLYAVQSLHNATSNSSPSAPDISPRQSSPIPPIVINIP